MHKFIINSIHDVECIRGGETIWKESNHNIVTNQGLNSVLNIMFNAATQISTWYCGVIETNTAAAATMTYATPVFTESTAYAEATRPAYVEAASTAQSMTNAASKATFTMNDTKTIYGTALLGGGSAADTKANTAGGGTLFCYSLFSSAKAVVSGDILKVTITIAAADA